MIRFLLLAALALPMSSAYAQKDFGAKQALQPGAGVSAVDGYFGAYVLAKFMCDMSYNMANSLSEISNPEPEAIQRSDYRSCIQQFTPTLKQLHAKAQKTLKTPAQKAALKEHYALAITALQGIAPLASERVIDYERRTNAESRSVDQQKNRFEAEQ